MSGQNLIDVLQSAAIIFLAIALGRTRVTRHGNRDSPDRSGPEAARTSRTVYYAPTGPFGGNPGVTLELPEEDDATVVRRDSSATRRSLQRSRTEVPRE